MTEPPADRHQVFDRPVRPATFAQEVRAAMAELDGLIDVNPTEEEVLLRRWLKRCKTKGLANTTKQYFNNPGLLVLMRQYYESSQNANQPDIGDTSAYLNPTASVSNSLTNQFKTILSEMQAKPLSTYKRDARVSIPVHRRPDINYLSEPSNLRRTAIATAALPAVVLTVTLFNPEKQQDRSEEVEILSTQTVGDLIAHVGCHAQTMAIDKEQEQQQQQQQQPEKICTIGDTVYTNATDKSSVAYVQRLSRYFHDEASSSKLPDVAPLSTRLDAVDIMLGQPNIISHDGNCRHVFIFKNARCMQLASKEDEALFPKTTFRGRINRIKCQMCTIYPAERVIVDDVHCGDTPMMMCICCYEMFFTSTEGQLLRDIKELPYHKTRMELDEGGDDTNEA